MLKRPGIQRSSKTKDPLNAAKQNGSVQPAQEITVLPNSRKGTATVLAPARTELILLGIQETAWPGS